MYNITNLEFRYTLGICLPCSSSLSNINTHYFILFLNVWLKRPRLLALRKDSISEEDPNNYT
jgi:hypothetical protein